MRIELRYTRGSVDVQRGARSFSLVDPKQLRLGDTLQTRPPSRLGLRLPGHQWLALRGHLRLDRIPHEGAGNARIQVTLLWGSVRARATSRGRGINIDARAHHFQADGGEYRVRLRDRHVMVESLDGYVTVSGLHAARTLPPGTRLELGPGSSGFAQRMLIAPANLRPTAARGARPPRLSWDRVAGATTYRVEIAGDTDFMRLVQSHTVTGQTLSPRALPRGEYFWQVTPINGRHLGLPSKIYGFQVDRAR